MRARLRSRERRDEKMQGHRNARAEGGAFLVRFPPQSYSALCENQLVIASARPLFIDRIAHPRGQMPELSTSNTVVAGQNNRIRNLETAP